MGYADERETTARLLTGAELDALIAAGHDDLVCRYEDAIVSRLEDDRLVNEQPWNERLHAIEDYLRRELGVSVPEAERVVNRVWGLEHGPYPTDLELARAVRVLASWAVFVRFAIKRGQLLEVAR